MTTTRLDIINSMLAANGIDPVDSPDSDHPDALSALPVMNRCNRNLQTKRWWFNQEYNLTLLPSLTGEILLPSNCLKVDPIDGTSWFVKRGQKLYDPQKHTFAIGASVIVNMTVLLDIEDLPDTAGQYLQAYATHVFYTNEDGDDNKTAGYLRERNIALAALNKEHLAALNLNATNRPSVVGILGGIRPFGGTGYRNPIYPGGR